MSSDAANARDWVFPAVQMGKRIGINDGNIVTFRAGIIRGVVRETVQNGLDVRKDPDAPVEMEFHIYKLPTAEIPGVKSIREYAEVALEDWTANSSKDTIKFFENAVGILSKDEIQMLRISDHNTTGLTGSGKRNGGSWNALVTSTGVSDKPENAGGSFGIGKNAVPGASELRTVVYSTIAEDGCEATEGVNSMPSCENKEGKITIGAGYWVENNEPIRECLTFDPDYKRSDNGTDIYVFGFSETDEDTENNMIAAVLEEFLVAIYNNALKVTVNDTVIEKNTLNDLIQSHKNDLVNARYYYQALTDPDAQIVELDVNGKQKAPLRILSKDDMNRKVMMCRSNGMKIMDKANYPAYLNFTGVCVLEDELNALFRKMEDQTHTDWKPEILKDKREKAEAKAYKQKLFKAIKDTIIEKGGSIAGEALGVSGLGEFFPNSDSSASGMTDNKPVKNDDVISSASVTDKVTVKTKLPGSPGREIFHADEAIPDEDGELIYTDKNKASGNEPGPEPTPHPEPPIPPSPDPKPVKPGDSKEVKAAITKIGNFKARVFLADKSTREYRLMISTAENIRNSYVFLEMVGEDISQPVNIRSAKDNASGTVLNTFGNRVDIGKIDKGSKRIISLDLAYTYDCALGVKLYGTV